jgi:hypothetical protein
MPMGQENLYVQIEGLRSFVETHQDVAAQVAGLLGATPHSADVASTHGSIASAVHDALGGTLDARAGVHRSVSAIADKLSESLKESAHHYEQVDQRASAAARTAEEGLAGAGQSPTPPAGTSPSNPAGGIPSNSVPGVAGTPAAATSTAAKGGSGQGLDQLGQLGGQMAQSLEGLGKGKGGGGNPLGQLVQTAEQIAQQFAQGRGDSADDPADGPDYAQPGDDTAAGKPPADQAPTQRTTPRPR